MVLVLRGTAVVAVMTLVCGITTAEVYWETIVLRMVELTTSPPCEDEGAGSAVVRVTVAEDGDMEAGCPLTPAGTWTDDTIVVVTVTTLPAPPV
jgi:hypothetical protein